MTNILWRPTQLGSPGGWWRADDRLLSVVSGEVSTAPDRSGRGFDLAKGPVGPVLVSNVVNGHPVIRFTEATPNFLKYSPVVPGSISIFTFWVVMRGATQDASVPVVATDNSSIAMFASDAPTRVYMNQGSGTPITPTHNWTTQFDTYICIFNGASSNMRINGTQAGGPQDVGSSTLVQIQLGAYTSTNGFDGDIAEAGMTFQALSGAKLTLLERYLRRRYHTW